MSTGRRSDSVSTEGSVSSESEHSALRTDIRRLSTLLGRTLARQNGEDMLDLVEKVRHLVRQAPEKGDTEIRDLLADLDPGTAAVLARAFSTYFHLANVAEQTHRAARAPGDPRAGRGPAPHARRPARLRGRPRRAADRAVPPRAQADLHRAPHRGAAPVGARQAARHRERPRRRPLRGGRREAAGAPGRPDLADRRDPPGAPDGARRGPLDRLLPRAARAPRRARDRSRCSTRSWPGWGSPCPTAPARSSWAAGSAATATATRTSPRSSPATPWSSTPTAACASRSA